MKVSIFGLGYVGCVGMGCLAKLGHEIIGVDVDQNKVNLINNGVATIVENEIDDLIKEYSGKNKIKATLSVTEAIANSDIAIICVGTPNNFNGHLDMQYIERVAEEIGAELKNKSTFLTIAIRSTVMPGTNRKIKEIIREKSNKVPDIEFGIVSNPEFLREGSAVYDFFNPPYTIIASDSKTAIREMQKLYKGISGEVIESSIDSAELIKFVNNSYHALKVAFANEIGRICKSLGADSHDLMNLFTKDKVLNISPTYFKPGFAYGGSCLPKDLKALNTIAHDKYVSAPILSAISESNHQHIDFAYHNILEKSIKDVGFLSITFKPGTDDLRFSPALELVERLLGRGFNVKVYDENINMSKLTGKNKEYLFNKLPHIDKILVSSLEEFLQKSSLIIIPNKYKDLEGLLKNKEKLFFDFSRSVDKCDFENYEGLCW